jgi:purine-nucleoside phosphorylase
MTLLGEKKKDLFERILESVRKIRSETSLIPEIAIVLGTGLGNLTQKMKIEAKIPYKEIPHFPVSTVESHAGELAFGLLSGKQVVAMEGRFHYYEGYSAAEVVYPVQVLREIGAKMLVVSNAAGGLNLDYSKGEIVLIEDHINFMGVNPLIGTHYERLGPRFPDMSEPYSKRLLKMTEEAAKETKIQVRRGVYVGVAGPCLETKAEYRMMRNFGADLVGMSTVPEVIAAVQMGMEILGVSVVTDVCDPDHLEPVDIKEIIRTANEAGPKLDKLIEAAIRKF